MLTLDFYKQDDVIELSRDLLGKFLLTRIGSTVTGGMILETEAYRGPEDKASHAYNNRRTKRNEVMYSEGGRCYVYLCYGIHSLFNIVVGKKDVPHAILIRAIEPVEGIELMLERRGKTILDPSLSSGPGTLTQALGITTQHNGLSLEGPYIWVEDRNIVIPAKDIVAGARVGVEYAGEDADLPWRFKVKKSKS